MSEMWTNRLAPLLNGRVVAAGSGPGLLEGEDGWPQLVIEAGGHHYRVLVSQDEEGNGPGFLFVDDIHVLIREGRVIGWGRSIG